jgi:hypothetical protein
MIILKQLHIWIALQSALACTSVCAAFADDGSGAFDYGGFKLHSVFKNAGMRSNSFVPDSGFNKREAFRNGGFRSLRFGTGKIMVKPKQKAEDASATKGPDEQRKRIAGFYAGSFQSKTKNSVNTGDTVSFRVPQRDFQAKGFGNLASGFGSNNLTKSKVDFSQAGFGGESFVSKHKTRGGESGQSQSKIQTDDLSDSTYDISKIKSYEPFSTTNLGSHTGLDTNGYMNHHLQSDQKATSSRMF